MSETQRIAVRTELVIEQLVGRILADVEQRNRDAVPEIVRAAGAIAVDGYLARCAEIEQFAAARPVTPDLDALLEATPDVAELARRLAADEPLERPEPSDGRAFSWRVPGPGGHVRHYLALASIAAAGRADRELKREWLFGFCVRCCEDATSDS